jgi:carbon monoxide dehydrogenase subunit G
MRAGPSVSSASRRRTIAASQAALWEIVADPHHQPRWWPGVERVEAVGDDRFTQVLRTRRGRPIRADFVIVEHAAPWTTAWRQELVGTPFARVLAESQIQVNLAPAGGDTEVTVSHMQRLRGYSWTGGLMLRRATGKRLDEALDGLSRVSTDAAPS